MMEPVDRGFRLFELASEDGDDIEIGHGSTSLIHIARLRNNLARPKLFSIEIISNLQC